MDRPQNRSAAPAYDIAIVGAGPAGLFGAMYAGMPGMRCVLLDALPEPGGQVAALYPEKYIYDMPGYTRIQGRELVQRLTEQALQFHTETRFGAPVTELKHNAAGAFVLTAGGASLHARTVLVCTGVGAFTANRLPLPEARRYEGRGVAYAVTDTNELADRDVVVVGGGDSAVDWALSLHMIARSVTLIKNLAGNCRL